MNLLTSNGVTVYVFGNPDLPMDALPPRLVPMLRMAFRKMTFEIKDPNEEWDVPEHLVVLDTVKGIDEVKIFNGLDAFHDAPRVSLHDYDALTQLRLLQKIGKLKTVTIIGVPPDMTDIAALKSVTDSLLRLAA